MRTATVVLPLALYLIACSTSQNSAPSTESADQPFSRITQASSTTQAELGVTTWVATHSPEGAMAIAGADASGSFRIVYVSNATQSALRTPEGTFEIVLDGDKVRSNTLARSPGALRTLELIGADLAPSGASASSATSPAAVPLGQLHTTDNSDILFREDGCQESMSGSLTQKCVPLVAYCGKANDDDQSEDWSAAFHRCMHSAGTMEQAKSDWDRFCTGGPNQGSPKFCNDTRGEISKQSGGLGSDHCFRCATDVWLISPDLLLHCPHVNSTETWMGLGVYHSCALHQGEH
jgi:hypothetical protein